MANSRTKKTSVAPSYDSEKRYDVTLARAVEHDGFTFKPGLTTTQMTGDLLNAIVDENGTNVIAEARELEPEPEHPTPAESVHEIAEQ